MAIFYPDILEHNNSNFALVDATQLRGNAYPLADLADTGSIPSDKRQVGAVVFTSGSGKYYGFTGDDVANWDTPSNWSEFVLSGASGTDLNGIFSGSFSGSFEGDGSGLTGVAPTAGDGIFVTGTTVSVDSASLATDMAGDFITATNGTLNLATSIGTLGTTEFTGSFSGSLDGSINIVDTNATASFQLVFREGTAAGFSTLYADQDNAKLRYNPGTNTLENTTLIGDVTGDLTGTATSASHVASAYDTVGVSNATISLTDMGGNTDQITVNNVVNSDSASLATTASYVETAQSASHVAAAFDTVSATNATITLTDMGGNNSSVTVNNVSNATTAVNATNATNATYINVEQATDDDDYNITFTATTSGNSTLLVDNNGKLTYNPTTDLLTVGSTLSVGGSATVGANLTVTGDLTVNGTTTTLNTTNLEVEDAYILLRSGSGTVGSSGIIFGGSEGAAQSGSALIWHASYNTNDGRLGITTGSVSSQTSDPDIAYYVAGVVLGNEAAAATAQADHQGNIRIDGSEIYIYV